MTPYDTRFFDALNQGALRSARVIVPYLVSLLQPRRVADLGCGEGAWLAAFREAGVVDVLGIDGDYVDRTRLAIPPQQFVSHDLTVPLATERPFDLALSLEVGEHLPPAAAETLVGSLTRLAPIVLFSAAIPFQGGTDHINEQWPAYWARLFQERGYVAVDCLRERYWNHPAVEWWYSQNMVLYGRPEHLWGRPGLHLALATGRPDVAARIHPQCYLRAVRTIQQYLQASRAPGGPPESG